ncbi:MAG: 1,2-phenylacetyl-CoA epoxidase, subunit C, partial [uncultured Rubrobacteraceae bacterium]
EHRTSRRNGPGSAGARRRERVSRRERRRAGGPRQPDRGDRRQRVLSRPSRLGVGRRRAFAGIDRRVRRDNAGQARTVAGDLPAPGGAPVAEPADGLAGRGRPGAALLGQLSRRPAAELVERRRGARAGRAGGERGLGVRRGVPVRGASQEGSSHPGRGEAHVGLRREPRSSDRLRGPGPRAVAGARQRPVPGDAVLVRAGGRRGHRGVEGRGAREDEQRGDAPEVPRPDRAAPQGLRRGDTGGAERERAEMGVQGPAMERMESAAAPFGEAEGNGV